MKLLIYISFILCSLSSCKKNFDKLSLDEQYLILEKLDESRLKNLFYKIDSFKTATINQPKIQSNFATRYSNYKGRPITYDTAKAYTDYYINSKWWVNSNNLEKSVYFSKTELDTFFALFPEVPNNNLGVRIYFAKYTDDAPNLEDRGKNTVILRATDNSRDIAYSDRRSAAYNFGDLCPKKCNRHISIFGYFPEAK